MPAMCCLTIGYVEVLMPADAGLKVVALLRGALRTQQGFDGCDRTYELGEKLQVEYCGVKAGQVRRPKPPTPDAAPLAIGREPLKLTHG